MPARLTVVLSQGQSQSPVKRGIEEDIVAGLLTEPGIDVTVIPNLYDLRRDDTGMLCLEGVSGHMVVLAWLYPLAIRWILDRNGIHGQEGTTLLEAEDEEEEWDEADSSEEEEAKQRVLDDRTMPDRRIYCVDLRAGDTSSPFLEEVKRIAVECSTQVVKLSDSIGDSPSGAGLKVASGSGSETDAPTRIDEQPDRRWYPVIDYSRCTNCMECIDFCLFGVYGVDNVETILVEQPDNCRKGCPACSRVCPENAIIFPQHKTPAIAGSPEAVGTLKIDLSKLFGQPEEDALQAAVRERDEQLVMVGRQTVGMTTGIPKRQDETKTDTKDDLDDLIDEVDSMEF